MEMDTSSRAILQYVPPLLDSTQSFFFKQYLLQNLFSTLHINCTFHPSQAGQLLFFSMNRVLIQKSFWINSPSFGNLILPAKYHFHKVPL